MNGRLYDSGCSSLGLGTPSALTLLLALAFAFATVPARAEIKTDASGNQVEYTHATMSDGVKLALAVGYPKNFLIEDKSRQWPTIFQMSGYQAATKAADPQYYEGYVTVTASLRGTGASEGKFSLFSDRSTRDGHEVIENWIVKQDWSNGKVGIHGHSWSGLTGFRIAATNPPHLRAVVVSGLFDDARRGLSQIGGIRNIGFPISWTSNFQRPDGVFGSDAAAVKNRNLSAAEASHLSELRSSRTRDDSPANESATTTQPSSLRDLAKDIRAPIFLLHAYQDQQTGPSGAWLFNYMPDDVPKLLFISNGHHGMPLRFIPARRAWFDFWLRGKRTDALPNIDERVSRVQAFFEVENRDSGQHAPLTSSDFPFPETQWSRFYLASNRLTSSPVRSSEAESETDTYQVVSDATDEDLDRIEYRLSFVEPTAICGPVVVTLWVSCTAADTDLFVTLSDVAPDGGLYTIQRGMLRTSNRAIDPQMSTYVDTSDGRLLIRPYHTLSLPEALEAATPYRLEIEVFPVGHVFREGHQLLLSISQPPLNDPVRYPKGKKGKVSSGSYKYESKPPKSAVTVHRSAEHPSSVLIPLLPHLPSVAESIPTSISKLWVRPEN